MDTSEEVDDKELIYLGKIVDRYKGKVSDVLKKIKSITVENMSEADVILSTAHKSKGLEFEQVMLTNDFVRFIDNSNRLLPFKMKEEEVNILYVAASRAKIRLRKNATLSKIVKYYEENKDNIGKKEKSIEYKKLKSKSMTLNKKIKSKIFNNGDNDDR
jgi:superfamily I DNA/RNA helicase